MQYFQYDTLRSVANFVVKYDLKNSDPSFIRKETGLEFAAPDTHSPWRNYSRIYKLCLLVAEINGIAVPTDVAKILSQSGVVTCDEYIHFIIEATTDPSPALQDWSNLSTNTRIRNPLCFVLKYILAKIAVIDEYVTPINEIIGAYIHSNFQGGESDEEYLRILPIRRSYEQIASSVDTRQARESIKFISQISYLHNTGSDIVASLSQEDARNIFHEINPISGIRQINGNDEILRLSKFFRDGSIHDFFDYKGTIISDVMESGFREGSKVKKTHIVIERNAKLRSLFFERFPGSICDSCRLDTVIKYPWVERVLDIHHILPLSSGTRVDSRKGTMLEDLAPICPTCHRAIHRYYDDYLKNEGRKDFECESEARAIYMRAKENIGRGDCYA